MALGFQSTSAGEFLPLLTYDARAGRMFKRDRVQGASGWETKNEDITNAPPTFAVDFRSIEVGWIAFTATGPSFALAPAGHPVPARPNQDHKNGFKVKVYGPQQLGGIREFSSSSKAVMGALDELHNTYMAAPEAAQGKIPVVQMAGTMPITAKGPQGTTTNYAPVFKVIQWIDRPAELGEATVALPAAGGQAVPSTPANHVPPPAAASPTPSAAMPF